jgi:hypothetical protein
MLAVPDILFWTPPHTFEKSAIWGSDSGPEDLSRPVPSLFSDQNQPNQRCGETKGPHP